MSTKLALMSLVISLFLSFSYAQPEIFLDTFDAIEQHFGFRPITALELGAFARRVRPQDFPSDLEARASNLVEVLNGRVLPQDLPGQWAATASFEALRGM